MTRRSWSTAHQDCSRLRVLGNVIRPQRAPGAFCADHVTRRIGEIRTDTLGIEWSSCEYTNKLPGYQFEDSSQSGWTSDSMLELYRHVFAMCTSNRDLHQLSLTRRPSAARVDLDSEHEIYQLQAHRGWITYRTSGSTTCRRPTGATDLKRITLGVGQFPRRAVGTPGFCAIGLVWLQGLEQAQSHLYAYTVEGPAVRNFGTVVYGARGG